MQRKKTKQEIISQFYLGKRDIRTLFKLSDKKANNLYDIAEKIDIEELGEYRIEPMKVRLTSVCKATGISLNVLQKLVKE